MRGRDQLSRDESFFFFPSSTSITYLNFFLREGETIETGETALWYKTIVLTVEWNLLEGGKSSPGKEVTTPYVSARRAIQFGGFGSSQVGRDVVAS